MIGLLEEYPWPWANGVLETRSALPEFAQITGMSGTGKTFLMEAITQAVKDRGGTTISAATYAKTALESRAHFTNTTHSIFGLPLRLTDARRRYDAERLRTAALIIVDQGQLLRADQIEVIMQCPREANFRGVLLLVSDQRQALPVLPDLSLGQRIAKRFANAAGFHVFTGSTYPLTRNMRMLEDPVLATAISRLDNGTSCGPLWGLPVNVVVGVYACLITTLLCYT